MFKKVLFNDFHSMLLMLLSYGLQLCSKVRTNEEDPKPVYMKELQLTQNRLLRALNNSKIKDRISTKSMLDKFDLLSVNQLAAQIKLIEAWKSVYLEGYTIVMEP